MCKKQCTIRNVLKKQCVSVILYRGVTERSSVLVNYGRHGLLCKKLLSLDYKLYVQAQVVPNLFSMNA